MLTKRLNKLISLIPHCNTFADVGCDHGYVGIEALNRKIVEQVLFVDISTPSLQKARLNCPDELADKVSFHCQDGLLNLQVDCAMIAGMGGLEIISILRQTKFKPHWLVLQPMRNQRDVRVFLLGNGYNIVTDEKFCDARYYDVIVAEYSQQAQTLTELELEFGKSNLESPTEDFVSFLNLESAKLSNILQGCSDQAVANKLALVDQALEIVEAKI